MIEPRIRRQIHVLHGHGWGSKAIAKELGIARNTVKRYLAGGDAAEVQTRPKARILDDAGKAEAERLFDGRAEGNVVVVARMLRDAGYAISVRRLQELLAPRRRERRAAQVATVRFETAPGQQLQTDFGQKLVEIAGTLTRVYLLVAVLSYSRRLFVKAFLAERQDDWREGIAEAFRHFGGVTQTVLGDNPRALVMGRDPSGVVRFHPAYLAFASDWGFEPRACAPYRARTKGKTEAGVKYVKRNAVAGRSFTSFAALQAHLGDWMAEADERVHGTTRETPRARFERAEKAVLRPLPGRPLPTRERRLQRRVSNDALVDIDTVRYSVPCRLVGDRVEVAVAEDHVRVFHQGAVVANHRRSSEPHSTVADKTHYAALWRPPGEAPPPDPSQAEKNPLQALGRSLDTYLEALGGGAA
jgi:transposase